MRPSKNYMTRATRQWQLMR